MSVRFNINDKVSVKLTEVGLKVYNKHFEDLGIEPFELKQTWDGRCVFQIHNLMNIFGSACYNGCSIPFETEVEFV